MPSLAKDLSVANGEFDQGLSIKGNHWGVRFREYQVSKMNQGNFNRRVQTVEISSLRVIFVILGNEFHIYTMQQMLCVVRVLDFDIASYESAGLKFQ
ncbi:MAG TPA: hypothetical protein VJ810_32980 [Blastocatellia bacterium]|nr:hypothetical protein [Blastocatellia bacterium]